MAMRRGRLVVTGAIAAVLLASGVAVLAVLKHRSESPGTRTRPPLVGTEWRMTSYQNPGDAEATAVTAESTLSINKGHRVGIRACNYMGGTVQIGDSTITFGDFMSTLMACTGEPAMLEAHVVATLKGKIRWSVSEGVLTFRHPDGHELTYRQK